MKTSVNTWVQKPYLNFNAINWVEIKTGTSQLSHNQLLYKDKSIIGVHVFRLMNDFPKSFSIVFENFYSKEIAESKRNQHFNEI